MKYFTKSIDYEDFCGAVSFEGAVATTDPTITPRELPELTESGGKLALIDLSASGEGLSQLPQDQ